MAGSFFPELGLPRPEHSLGIEAARAGADRPDARRHRADPLRERPDAVLVYGDTNSTLAGALAAAKPPSPWPTSRPASLVLDRTMPEEVNRVVADHISRWLFAPTSMAVANLAAEGVTDGVLLVGDVLQDLAARTAAEVADPAVLAGIEGRASAAILLACTWLPARTCLRRSTAPPTATRTRCRPGQSSWARSPAPSGR